MIFFVLGMMSQSIAQENTADHKETLKEEVVAISHEAHEAEEEFKMQDMIFNHINNSNEFHLFGHIAIPLPCILYSKEDGFTTFLSSKLHHGSIAYNR